jgi:competence/damage-inducible protein CinA-like protein
MPTAEILTIGTELLLGEITDTNATYIARVLRDNGVDLYYSATVGDNVERIAVAIKQAMERAEIVITTGGLGPTVDDATRDAVAKAVGVETEFRDELWAQVLERFNAFGRIPTENNKRQAYVPQGALGVKNEVGTAPSFIVETEKSIVISLPGVPREMEHLMHHAVLPYLREHFDLRGMIKARVLKTSGVGESQIDQLIADLEYGSNPTVGLSAHAGQVDIRITAKADSEEGANALIAPVEADLRERMGEWVFGADEDTLESVALANMAAWHWKLVVVESGLGGALTAKLAGDNEAFSGGEVLNHIPGLEELEALCHEMVKSRNADACIGVALERGEGMQTLHMVRISPTKHNAVTRTYGGPPKLAETWAVATALDVIRRMRGKAD